MLQIVRRLKFSCAHFYNQPTWSEEKNLANFGKCYSQFGHGHDYILDLFIRCKNASEFDKVCAELVETLDHKHLNFTIPEFATTVPTTENLALYCVNFLQKKAPGLSIQRLRLFEKDDLWVELNPES